MANQYDVAIVGASLAGCTAAVLFARAGLSVALIERHPDIDAYKSVCTHFVQPSGVPTLKRLGLLPQLQEEGAVMSGMEFWSRRGWVRPDTVSGSKPSVGLNLRREKLDPAIRRLAACTPGVDLRLGTTARSLIMDDGAIAGVVVDSADGTVENLSARLTVGADGRESAVARMAGVAAKKKRHERFMYYAYYRDIDMGPERKPRIWVLEPDLAYAFPTDDDLTLIACAPAKNRLGTFKADLPTAFANALSGLPDCPQFDDSKRVGGFKGMVDYQNVYREVVRPGLALIGDAALVADFIWGVGCGWAFQSAEWLVDTTAQALNASGDVSQALNNYKKRHHSELHGHFFMIADFATGRSLNPIEKVFLAAGVTDPVTAEHFGNYASRNIGLLQLISPPALLRAVAVALRR